MQSSEIRLPRPSFTKQRIVALVCAIVLNMVALQAFTTPAHAAPNAAAQRSCDRANSGAFDRTGTQPQLNATIAGAQGYLYTVLITGLITNALVSFDGNTLISGPGTRSAQYRFRSIVSAIVVLHLIGNASSLMTVRCKAPTTPTTPSDDADLKAAREVAIATATQLISALFSPLLTADMAITMLTRQTGMAENLLGLIQRRQDLIEKIAANERRAAELAEQMSDPRFGDATNVIDYESQAIVDYILPGALFTPAVREYIRLGNERRRLLTEVASLQSDLESTEDALKAAGVDLNTIPAPDGVHSVIDEVGGQLSLAYAPNPYPQATGPLSVFNAFDNSVSDSRILVQRPGFTAWAEFGVAHNLGNGTNGQSGFAAGLKVGAAARINDMIAVAGDIFGVTGTFGATGIGLTGDFTQFGTSITPVLRIDENLFLSVTGRFAHLMVNQSLTGATAAYTAEQFGLDARLQGAFWANYFLIEPDATLSWDYLYGAGVTASNGATVGVLNDHSFGARAGGRVSFATIPSGHLPSVTPYGSAHVHWSGSGTGSPLATGFGLDLGTGVTAPLGDTGSASFGLVLSNLFNPGGTVFGGNFGLQGAF